MSVHISKRNTKYSLVFIKLYNNKIKKHLSDICTGAVCNFENDKRIEIKFRMMIFKVNLN